MTRNDTSDESTDFRHPSGDNSAEAINTNRRCDSKPGMPDGNSTTGVAADCVAVPAGFTAAEVVAEGVI
jgi:hypothetical protein